MSSLARAGFSQLVADVAAAARKCSTAGAAVELCLTLDRRTDRTTGAQALSPSDLVTYQMLGASAAQIDPAARTGVTTLELTTTGRVRFGRRAPDGDGPSDAHLIGTLAWPADEQAELEARRAKATAEARDTWAQLRDHLAHEPAERVQARLAAIAEAVVHMAPVLLYVGDRVYSNLGALSNLPGKSFELGQAGCVLTELSGTPVAQWALEDACLVACLGTLLESGPPVRLEEFNGTQLTPDRLEAFLAERLREYGAVLPHRTDLRLGAWLERLAVACAKARSEVLAAGTVAYRVIHGLNLHKRERLMRDPLTLCDVPAEVRAFVAQRCGDDLPESVLEAGGPVLSGLAQRLVGGAAPEGFSSGLEEFLDSFLTVAAEAAAADVAMSRGPRSFAPLLSGRTHEVPDPLTLRTNDFYCCVTPRRAFAESFDDPADLVKTLCAYSARMRFNTWHYLPHTLGIQAAASGSKRSDWFFAPTMPDLTDWSDQHHTGHVDFGVRYAIRVPFGVRVDGRELPGIYDLRLMRTTEPAFTVAELRAAIATGRLLQQVYQAMLPSSPLIVDFTNGWFRSRYG